MFEFLIQSIDILLPIFIFCAMANVGMTQDPKKIVGSWKDWRFLTKMALANFVAAPAIMILLLLFWPMPESYKAALFVFSLCAGAPFLIKLAEASGRDIALAAGSMMALVFVTVIVVPIVLPLMVPSMSVDRGSMAWNLARQLIFPIIGGALVAHFLPKLNQTLQPWIATVGNIALYALIFATIVGYLPDIPPILGSGALIAGLLFIVVAFAIGYAAGGGKDYRGEVGALATAQRNTAAAMLIAASNFEDPMVFVLIAMVNSLGIAILLLVAREMKQKTPRALPA